MSFPGASAGKDGRHQVLDDLWFAVRKNEVFAFLGPNGAGKSTTINIITGLLKPVSGTATVCGKTPDDPAIKRLYGVCPQYDHTYRTMSVYNHLRVFAEIKGVPAEHVRDAVETAIEDAMLQDFRHRAVKELSGGTRRRLTIAIACLGRPAVVILDEPTTGVDIATRRTIWEMINRLKQHMSVLLVTHDMDEADRLSQRAGIMINGALVCLGSPARLKSLFGSAYLLKLQFAYGTRAETLDGTLAAIQSKVESFQGNVIKMRLVHRGESSMEIAIDMPDETKDNAVVDDASSTQSVAHANFLGEMLEFVTDNRRQWNVTDFTLGELTLTELFVRLAQHHRSYQDEEAGKHQ
ncbi:P-loop containing nucleoside triphosphate hydrolase protein [Catenaria anguillulae PL171]|uniref:p-loop containing nucleoside triphosphate hydrolase protein n=1 Tax=Catenaria anguillulae PL171 TaxID=765915 RepID=A0A1Y2HCR8_9FUNG|nr:P-loop containing nucleoside triphosphate hydrolase protein [Catenaria anguillulae PL171]